MIIGVGVTFSVGAGCVTDGGGVGVGVTVGLHPKTEEPATASDNSSSSNFKHLTTVEALLKTTC